MSAEDLLSLTSVAVIAHRNETRLCPENTTAAFDHALRLGVDGLECDLRLSRNGEPVVIHDATLERTTDGRGPVGELTADDLSRLDAGYHFGAERGYPFRGCGLGVSRLSDLLARYADARWLLEIKGDQPIVAERVLDVVRRAGAASRVIIGGFDRVVLNRVRHLAPAIPTGASREEVRRAFRRSRLWLRPGGGGFRVIQAPLRLQGERVLDERFVRAVRRAGIPVQAWIVDDAAEMRRLIRWGVTGLITDRPDVAVPTVEDVRASGA